MSESRKKDHIDQAMNSVPTFRLNPSDIYYEPLFSAHPKVNHQTQFLHTHFDMPLWVSSMTGGTEKALRINQNLAKACLDFNIGMGLGSCRPLLESNDRFDDFNMRPLMGDRPLYANLGIAQLEIELEKNKGKKINELVKKLEADGLIIHVNPLQEFFQPEGDRFSRPPLETIMKTLDIAGFPIMVKEVGQGFGPNSLKALINLPLECLELSAFGGTNFTKLEQMRSTQTDSINNNFSYVGHTAAEMIEWINDLWTTDSPCKSFIISGGVKTPLEGHFLKHSLKAPSIIGMASQILKYAMGDYDELSQYLKTVQDGFNLANAYMRSEK